MTRILGINDDKDTCCQCGRTELKRVVWIEHEDGSVQWYGTSCAARIMYKANTKQNRATVLQVATQVQSRTDAVNAAATKHAAESKSTAEEQCRERNYNTLRQEPFTAAVRTLENNGRYYSYPSSCTDSIQALLDRGWKEAL